MQGFLSVKILAVKSSLLCNQDQLLYALFGK